MKNAVIVLVIALTIGGYYYVNMSTPEKTVRTFEDAYNRMDVNEMLDCYDPTYSRAIKAGLNIVGSFTKVNPNDILEFLPLIYKMVDETDTSIGDKKPEITIEIVDIKKSGKEAQVEALITLNIDSKSEEVNGNFYLTKIDRQWYITGLN